MNFDQARFSHDDEYELLLSEKGSVTAEVDPEDVLPDDLTRDELTLPALSEPQSARHYMRLSQMSYSVELGPYPLGSCTMKYNPSFAEDVAVDPNAGARPNRSDRMIQGTLGLLHGFQEYLTDIGGMDAVTLQSPAGVAGESTGILVAKACHESRGDDRSEIIVPSSAHGMNFTSAAMAGYDVVELPSDDDGRVDVEALDAAISEETAALMLTNPNMLGSFGCGIVDIVELIHDADGLLYYDGANLDALPGRAHPGDMGFDTMYYNAHKTFTTPYGGGGPGADLVGVVEEFAEFLSSPMVYETAVGYEQYESELSIGKVHDFAGNWFMLVKAYVYIARLGDAGLVDASAKAVLNANYLASQLDLDVPYGPLHREFTATPGDYDATDAAKRMFGYGVHSPTTKWPELVSQAMLTEPTEVEDKASLDDLARAFNAACAGSDEALETAPSKTGTHRIDQVSVTRNLWFPWRALGDDG